MGSDKSFSEENVEYLQLKPYLELYGLKQVAVASRFVFDKELRL
jgi:hypothetical protein